MRNIVYFKCNSLGNIKYECLVLIKKMKKCKKSNKSLIASWSKLDELKDDAAPSKDKEANLCLMGVSKVNSNSNSDDNSTDVYDEIKELYTLAKAKTKICKLNNENKNLKKESKIAKTDNEALNIDLNTMTLNKESLKNKNRKKKEEIIELKVRIDGLSQMLDNTFNNFNESDKKSQIILFAQCQDIFKFGLRNEHR